MSASLATETAPNTVSLKSFAPYVGSRELAVKACERLVEIVKAGKIATLDLDHVAVMTPAFVDECFGGLYKALGEEKFRTRVEFKNVNESCKLLMEAIVERHAGPGTGPKKADADPVSARGEEE